MFEYIYLERTGCYGTCPIYIIKIFNNGAVKYFGSGFVEKLGKHTWTLSQNKIDKLENLLNEFNYKSFLYDPLFPSITCQASCITKVKFSDGTIKKIDHYLGIGEYKDTLEKFENRIDKIIGSRKYTFLPEIK